MAIMARRKRRTVGVWVFLVATLVASSAAAESSALESSSLSSCSPTRECQIQDATSSAPRSETPATSNSTKNKEKPVTRSSTRSMDTTADDQCTLYLARSTIPGAGLGIFTSIPRQPGATVGYGDVMIPLVDVWYHWQAARQSRQLLQHPDAMSLDVAADYVWFGPELGMTREAAYLGLPPLPKEEEDTTDDDADDDEDADDAGDDDDVPFYSTSSSNSESRMIWPNGQANTEFIVGLAPGLDAAINCHLALNNVEKGSPLYYDHDIDNDDPQPHPGRGASSRYHSSPTVVLQHTIPAGGELFKDYGEQWFVSRTESLGYVPLENDFVEAERLLQTLHEILERHHVPQTTTTIPSKPNTTTTSTTATSTVRRDLWQLLQQWKWGGDTSRTLRVFQGLDYLHWPLVVRPGMRAAQQTKAKRSPKFLQKHGRCLDHIKFQPSTLGALAGNGAVATRVLPQGLIITGTPVMLVPSGEFFDMYEGDWYGKTYIKPEQHVGHQLWLNYCWHPPANVSSIYLCPYGSGVNFINHAPTTTTNHTTPTANARFQWAPDRALNHNATLLRTSPAEWYDYNRASSPDLHVDLVALRDIAPGEEVLVDYGPDWERAWQQHVEQWDAAVSNKPPHNYYQSPRVWNRHHAHDRLRTTVEQQDEPYPDNFELYCLPELNSDDPEDVAAMQDSVKAQALWKPSTLGYPCRVIQREWRVTPQGGAYWYRVAYVQAHVHDPQRIVDDKDWMGSDWVVREAMRFEDKPYTTDMFWKPAFRHPIGFPDDMFPEAWRGVFLAPLPPANGYAQ